MTLVDALLKIVVCFGTLVSGRGADRQTNGRRRVPFWGSVSAICLPVFGGVGVGVLGVGWGGLGGVGCGWGAVGAVL